MQEQRKTRAKPLAEVVPYRIARLNAALVRLLTHFCESEGISFQQWRVLSLIGNFGAVAATEIAQWTTNDKALVSRVLSQMESAGLIERRVSLEDGRRLTVLLTEEGHKTYARIGSLLDANELSLLEGMNPEEVAVLVATLKRLEERTNAQLQAIAGARPSASGQIASKSMPRRRV